MAWLREQGYTVDKVEQKVRRNVTRDFMGFADIIGISLDAALLAVQATSAQHLHERVAKIVREPRALLWLRCGGRIWVVAWGLAGAEGKRKTYRGRVVEIVVAAGQLAHTDPWEVE